MLSILRFQSQRLPATQIQNTDYKIAGYRLLKDTNQTKGSKNSLSVQDQKRAKMSEAAVAVQAKKNPSDFLRQVLGKPVIVQLNSGTTYRGTVIIYMCVIFHNMMSIQLNITIT